MRKTGGEKFILDVRIEMYKNINQILCSRINWKISVYIVRQTPDLRYL